MHVLLRGRSASTLSERRAELDTPELDGGRHEVDVRGDVLWEVVPAVARKVLRAAVVVLVHVVLRGEEALCLCDGDVQLQVRAVLAELDARAVDAVIHEPRVDGVYGLLGRPERLRYACGCPVLTVIGGGGVCDFKQVVIEVVEVGLPKGNAEGNECVWVSATVKRPSLRDGAATLVEDTPRKKRARRRAGDTRHGTREANK